GRGLPSIGVIAAGKGKRCSMDGQERRPYCETDGRICSGSVDVGTVSQAPEPLVRIYIANPFQKGQKLQRQMLRHCSSSKEAVARPWLEELPREPSEYPHVAGVSPHN